MRCLNSGIKLEKVLINDSALTFYMDQINTSRTSGE